MVWWWLAGCSLGVTAYTPCTSGDACREAFGLGYTCGDAGLCEPAPAQPRCDATWPEDLLQRPEDYPGVLVVGSLYDHTTDVPEEQSTRLAVKQVDESEGVGGTPVGLVQCSYEEDASLDPLPALVCSPPCPLSLTLFPPVPPTSSSAACEIAVPGHLLLFGGSEVCGALFNAISIYVCVHQSFKNWCCLCSHSSLLHE
jgi:hypothetical protein